MTKRGMNGVRKFIDTRSPDANPGLLRICLVIRHPPAASKLPEFANPDHFRYQRLRDTYDSNSILPTSADYAEALLTARRAKAVVISLLVLLVIAGRTGAVSSACAITNRCPLARFSLAVGKHTRDVVAVFCRLARLRRADSPGASWRSSST
jgi:hypothetical protein